MNDCSQFRDKKYKLDYSEEIYPLVIFFGYEPTRSIIWKEEWMYCKRLEIIKLNIIKRYIKKCTWNPMYKLARKLIYKKAGYIE